MRYTALIYPSPGEIFSQEAADSLVGQELLLGDKPATIVEATFDSPSILITVEVNDG